MNRRFYVTVHQDKAKPYIDALVEKGWRPDSRVRRCAFLLMDVDAKAYRERIEMMWARRVPAFVYPHAGPPSLFGDIEGYEPSRRVKARFVPAAGHVEVMRAYGYPGKIIVVGWSWCPIRAYNSREIKRILFMPIHPNSNHFLSARDKKLNVAAFERAWKIATELNAHLVVRHLLDLKDNGLTSACGCTAEYKMGLPSIKEALKEIERADLAIAHHTPAYLAVASGVTTLMIGEHETPLIGGRDDQLYYALHWNDYKDLMTYPLDILTADDPTEMARQAAVSDRLISDWRERMIGEPFNKRTFVDNLEAML